MVEQGNKELTDFGAMLKEAADKHGMTLAQAIAHLAGQEVRPDRPREAVEADYRRKVYRAGRRQQD